MIETIYSMKQATLHFENRAPIAATADPSTSHEAGAKLTASGRRDEQKGRVLEALRKWPLTTSAELAQWAKLDRFLVARRLPDLERDGFVERQGKGVCRISGNSAVVWRARK